MPEGERTAVVDEDAGVEAAPRSPASSSTTAISRCPSGRELIRPRCASCHAGDGAGSSLHEGVGGCARSRVRRPDHGIARHAASRRGATPLTSAPRRRSCFARQAHCPRQAFPVPGSRSSTAAVRRQAAAPRAHGLGTALWLGGRMPKGRSLCARRPSCARNWAVGQERALRHLRARPPGSWLRSEDAEHGRAGRSRCSSRKSEKHRRLALALAWNADLLTVPVRGARAPRDCERSSACARGSEPGAVGGLLQCPVRFGAVDGMEGVPVCAGQLQEEHSPRARGACAICTSGTALRPGGHGGDQPPREHDRLFPAQAERLFQRARARCTGSTTSRSRLRQELAGSAACGGQHAPWDHAAHGVAAVRVRHRDRARGDHAARASASRARAAAALAEWPLADGFARPLREIMAGIGEGGRGAVPWPGWPTRHDGDRALAEPRACAYGARRCGAPASRLPRAPRAPPGSSSRATGGGDRAGRGSCRAYEAALAALRPSPPRQSAGRACLEANAAAASVQPRCACTGLTLHGPHGDQRRPARLTAREREVLALVAQGRTRYARSLVPLQKTVRHHVSSLLRRLARARAPERSGSQQIREAGSGKPREAADGSRAGTAIRCQRIHQGGVRWPPATEPARRTGAARSLEREATSEDWSADGSQESLHAAAP